MSQFLKVNCSVLLLVMLAWSSPSFASLITIDKNVQDVWWWNGIAEANSTELRTNDVSKSNQRIGVQFNDLSSLAGYKITSAELQLYRYSGYWGSDADMTIDAYAITSAWHESSIIPSYDSYAIATTTYTDSEAKGWQSWDLTELIQGWMAEEVVNNGVMLAGIGDNYFQRFYSSEKIAYGPRLIINTIEVPEPKHITTMLLLGFVLLFFSRNLKEHSK